LAAGRPARVCYHPACKKPVIAAVVRVAAIALLVTVRLEPFMIADTFRQDLRFAARMLLRNPGFTAAALVTLSLGIGATTAVFSVVDGVLLRPAAFENMDRLVVVWETDRAAGTIREPSSVPDYFDFRQRCQRFGDLAAIAPAEMSLTPDHGDPARLAALAVTHGFLPLVGVHPIVGRSFEEEEDRPDAVRVALISETLWSELFGRDPAAVGRTVRLDDIPHVVVGVLPASADFGTLQVLGAAAYGRGFAERGGQVRVDVWVPLRMNASSRPRDNHPIIVVGRLRAGTTVIQAQEELGTITADLERAHASNHARGAFVEPLAQVIFGPVRPVLGVLLGAVALVLLAACANVANLLLVRAMSRTREVTVRAALGAGRGRLARQFLVEGVLLAVSGCALGVLLAKSVLGGLLALAPANIPRIESVAINRSVIGAALAVTAAVALFFGMIPVLHARRTDLRGALQGAPGRTSAGRGQARIRVALVVTELALAVMLLAGSGLLIRSLWHLQSIDPGFRAAGVLKAEFQLPASRYPQNMRDWPNWTEAQRFTRELRARVGALPGVEAATVAGDQPLAAGFTSSIRVVGREAEASGWPEPSIRRVDATYFETMGVRLVAGRRFDASDRSDSQAVIMINEAARRRFFEAGDPLGQRIALWGLERTVVGVVADERVHGLAAAAPPAVYLPTPQTPIPGGSLLVRARLPAESLVPAVRRVVRDLDPSLPLFGVEALEQTVASSLGQRRFAMRVLVVFAALALALAVAGVYAVLSYSVAQRTRELGIRLVLGAAPGTLWRLVLGEGARMAAVGLVLGLAGALGTSRVLTSLLFGVRAADPVTLAGVAALLGAVAVLASWLPARRAAAVSPAEALRSE